MLSNNRHSAIESNSAFTAKVEDLVREIVIQNDILYYRIESKVDHLANVGGEDNFMPVIRIITYFEDTVSQIADLLSSEFEIVAESAVDKKKSRVESFSYKHIQYLVGLKANRRELTEYKRSGDKKFEIQICSMLQDAWAGIEKELGYDSASFPEEGKRDLYRVGALLEMADLEFLKIRSKFIIPTVAEQATPVSEPMEAVVPATYTPAPQPVQETPAPRPQFRFDPLPEPVAVTPEAPVYQAPPAPVYEAPAPVYQAPPAPVFEAPAPAYQAPPTPVYEAPAPVFQAPPTPVYETPAPVVQAPPAPVFEAPVAEVAPVAPQLVMQAPMGIAPKPAKIEIPETIVAAAVASAPVVEEIVQVVEPVAPVYEAPAAPVFQAPPPPVIEVPAPVVPVYEAPAVPVFQAPVAPVYEAPVAAAPVYAAPAAPVFQAPPAPVYEAPAPAPVYEVPVPVAEIPVAAPAPQVISVDPVKVSVKGNIESIAEPIVDGDSQPFFEDLLDDQSQAKTVAKAAPLDENAPITDASLKEYVLKSKLLKEIDSQIAERAGARINSDIDIEGDVERLRFLKVYTLKQLHDRLKDNKDDVVAFAEKWIGKDNGGSFDSGISLFYLEYLLVGKKNDPAFAVEYVVKFISDNDYSARYIIPTYNSIRNTEAPNFSHLTLK